MPYTTLNLLYMDCIGMYREYYISCLLSWGQIKYMACPFTGVLFGCSLPCNIMLCPWKHLIIFLYSLLLSIPFTSPLWPCIFCYILSAFFLYNICYPLYHSIHSFPPIAFPLLLLCFIYHRYRVSISSFSHPFTPSSQFPHSPLSNI